MKWWMPLLLANSLYSITLKEAEEKALNSNVAIKISELQAREKELQSLQALLSWFPEVNYGAMAAVLQKPQEISRFQRQKKLFSNQFTVTQPLFSSSLLGDLRLSRLAKAGGILGKDIAINETLYQVRTNYLLFGLKVEESALDQMKLASLQRTYQDEEVKFKAGRSTQLQVARAKAAISYEISNQMARHKVAMQAKHDLSLLLHLSPEEEVLLSFTGFPSIQRYPMLTEKLQVLQAYLMENTMNEAPPSLSLFTDQEVQQYINLARVSRPELKKSSLIVQAAQVKQKQSFSQYFPEMSAFVDYGYYQPVNGQFFRQRNDWVGGIQLSWSLFDSLKREMKSKEVVALNKAAKLAYSYEYEKLEVTIRQDLRDIEGALLVYQNAQENQFLAKETLEAVEIQYEVGSASEINLRDAKQFYLESTFNLNQALAGLLQKYYSLVYDLGTDEPISNY